MTNKSTLGVVIIVGGLLVLLAGMYIYLRSKKSNKDSKRIKELRRGTQQNKYSLDVIYLKLYSFYKSVPMFKRYLLRLRNKLEVIYMQDEYKTRKQAAKAMTNTFLIIIPVIFLVIIFTRTDPLLLTILLAFIVIILEALMSGMIDKFDTKLLKQQVSFFTEIRHTYHEYNMVEEAIYETSQNDELEVGVQGQKVYEILISEDPESELEEYYDTAPNSFLKEFAGISYLTKEFGDRTDKDGSSLYLKNLENITKEMQMEIMKRDRIDYAFQSLSIISILPALCIAPLKNWAINNFAFTAQFYEGKIGLYAQIALIVLTIICYFALRKIKDTGNIKEVDNGQTEKSWQMKLYNFPTIKVFMDLLIPKNNTKNRRLINRLIKDSASSQKIEALYINKLLIFIIAVFLTISLFLLGHKMTRDYIYSEPTADYNLLGGMSERQKVEAMKVTEAQNIALNHFKGNLQVTKQQILDYLPWIEYYKNAKPQELDTAADKVLEKLNMLNSEVFQWYELIFALVVGFIGYCIPTWLLILQKNIRKLDMENEVMEFQTIILMLMKIERIDVEMILEWLERYANIFKEPITKCLNNFEAGGYEALEELKSEIAFPQLVRIIENLQVAVEKIPIREAFDEFDNEKEYYQEKREESNERLIKRKSMIGKVIGFAPMFGIIIGYLIVPLIVIGMSAMTQTMSGMQGAAMF